MAKKKKTEKTPRELTRRQISAHRRQMRRQRIVFIGGIAIIAAIVLVILGGWLNSEFIPMHRTVITVNGTKFDTADFIGYLEAAGYDQQSQNQQQGSSQGVDMSQIAATALQQLPTGELMRQSADQLGITVSDQDIADDDWMLRPDVQWGFFQARV